MNFFKTVSDSIYSPPFYASIPKKTFGEALKYFFLLALLFAMFRSVIPTWEFLSVFRPEINTFIDQARTAYPPELELRIRNGTVITNVQEPYIIPYITSLSIDSHINLVVIDTRTPFSAARFNEYKTFAWVTKDAVFARGDGDNEIRTFDLSQTSDFTLNKAFVDSLVQSISPWLNLITPLALIGIFLMMFTLHTMRLVYLLFLAILIWLMMKLIKMPLSYGGSYKMGLYAMTTGFLAELAFEWTGFSGFPFMFTLITLAVIAGNLAASPKKSQTK